MEKLITVVLMCVLVIALFVGCSNVKNNPVGAQDANVCSIQWNANKQVIDGFGASSAFIETLGPKGFQNYSEPSRSQILDLLFDQTKGIGLSWIRNRIPQIEPTEGRWEWTKDSTAIWLMNEAKKRGVTKFFSTTWSPPGWMKTNKISNNGDGFLLTEKYQAYAEYLSKYIREYKTRFNIDISAVSIQNEADNAPDYEGCKWTADNFNDFIKNNLTPTFSKDGIKVQVVMPEASLWSRTEELSAKTLNDPISSARVDIIAAHPYDGGYDSLTTAISKGKKIWSTEVSSYEGANDSSISDGLKYAVLIHNQMTVAQINAFFYWWLVSESNTGQALINLSTDNTSYVLNKRLYTIGNFSRFIRPGYIRVDATMQPKSGIYVSTYKDPVSKKLVIVAINDTDASQSIDFKLNEAPGKAFTPYTTSDKQNLEKGENIDVKKGVFSASLPPKSIITFVDATVSTPTSIQEKSVTPTPTPSPVIIPNAIITTDTMKNFDNIYLHTAYMKIHSDLVESCEGDTSVLQRTSNTNENIIYNFGDIRKVNMKIYYNDINADSDNFKIYASATNGNFKEVQVSKDIPILINSTWWYRVNYTADSFPSNTNFVKIEIPQNTKADYTPVISEVKITSMKGSTEPKPKITPTPVPTATPTPESKLITDKEENWKSSYSHSANVWQTNIGAEATEGDTFVIQRKTNTTENVIYKLTNMKTAKIKVYFNDSKSDSNNIKIYISSADGDYKEVAVSKSSPVEIVGGWFKVDYLISDLPAGMNFLKIEMPENTKGYFTPVVSEVEISG